MKYLMPAHPDRTDRAVQRQLAQWHTLAEREGLAATKAQVVDQLFACLFWFDTVYGARAAYKLFQTVADGLVDDELPRDATA